MYVVSPGFVIVRCGLSSFAIILVEEEIDSLMFYFDCMLAFIVVSMAVF